MDKKIKTVRCIDNSIYINENKNPQLLQELKLGDLYTVSSEYDGGVKGREILIENSNGYKWWYLLDRFEVVEYYE